MPLGERFQSGGVRGVARFLAEHQEHHAGFDVLRGDGQRTGRLRITCKGCGESVEYQAAEAGDLVAPARAPGDNGEAAPRSRAPDRGAPPPTALPRRGAAAPRPRGLLFPGWFSAAAIVTLIGGGLVLVGVGLMRDTGESPSTPGPTFSAPAPAPAPATAPPPTAQPAEQPPRKAAGSQPVPLHMESFGDRFEIGVAPHWRMGETGSAVTITAPGSDAEIDIHVETGSFPADELADAASSFLRERPPDGNVGIARPRRLAHTPALKVTERYAGGSEVAIVLSTGGYTFLLLGRKDNDVPAPAARQMRAELASFNPS